MINIEELIQQVAETAHVERAEAERFVQSLLASIQTHLEAGEEVEVQGLGTFSVVDPQNEKLRRYAFCPDEKMRQAVNAPFNCFEPVVIAKQAVKMAEEAAAVVEEPSVEELEDTPVAEPAEIEELVDEPLIDDEPLEKEELEEEEPANDSLEKPKTSEVPAANESETPPAMGNTNTEDEEEEESDTTPWYESMLSWGPIVLLSLALLGLAVFLYYYFENDTSHLATPTTVARTDDSIVQSPAVIDDSLTLTHVATKIVEGSIKETMSAVEPKKETAKPAVGTKKEEPKPVIEPKKEEPKPAVEPKREEVKPTTAPHFKKGDDGTPVTVTLAPGERLTVLAQREFGDKAFWPYIYEVNSDKLHDPNNVPAGVTLKLPDPEFYGIDVNDPSSLRKAKNRAAQLLK